MNLRVFECLKQYFRKYLGWMILIIILAAVSVLLNFLYPLLLSQMISRVEERIDAPLATQAAVLFIVLSSKNIAQLSWNQALLKMSQYFNIQEYRQMYEKLFKVSYEEIKKKIQLIISAG